jgi:hypothetical protein
VILVTAGTAPAQARYWKEEGHQTSGGLSLSRSEGPTAPFCEKGAVHNPNERSHSRSLIQVKIHSRRALLKQQSRQRPPTLDGFAFVPPRAAFLGGIHWVAELASEVMRQTSPSSLPSAQRRGTLSPTTEE